MKFLVVAGKHTEKGKVYTKGQAVESDRPLDKIFINKFTPVEKAEDVPVEDPKPTKRKSPPQTIVDEVEQGERIETPAISVETPKKAIPAVEQEEKEQEERISKPKSRRRSK